MGNQENIPGLLRELIKWTGSLSLPTTRDRRSAVQITRDQTKIRVWKYCKKYEQSPKEIAARFRVSPATIRKWVKEVDAAQKQINHLMGKENEVDNKESNPGSIRITKKH